MTSFKKILFFQTAFLGDAVLAIPVLKSLRFFFPDAKIGFVCRQGLGHVFLNVGLADVVMEVNKKNTSSLKDAFQQTKNFKADLILSAHRSFRTAAWVWRLKGAQTLTVGFKDPWTFFAYKKRVQRPQRVHDVYRQLSILGGIGIETAQIPQELISLDIRQKIHHNGMGKFQLHDFFQKDVVALAPGSQWQTKRWTAEGFEAIGRKLAESGRQVLLLGAPDEASLCADLAQKIPGALNLGGITNILDLTDILKNCKALVCNDSGAMHVATAMDVPVVSIFGPTVPAQGYAPFGRRVKVVEKDLKCRPCGAHGHQKCPLGTHECMKAQSADSVWSALEEVLA